MHECPLQGGHLGIQKTLSKMKGRFFWQNMNNDIKNLIKSCLKCQMRKSNPSQLSCEPLIPLPTPMYPFARVHADLLGPLPTTDRNNKYIFSVVDAFSKWLIALPTTDQTALTVTRFFIDDVITRFGVPDTVVTDGGRQFVGNLFKESSKMFGFRHTTTTPYHPACNGQVERSNRVVSDMLAAYVNDSGTDWDLYLQLTTFAYNSSIQASANFSPYFILFGREPTVPMDLALEIPKKMTLNSNLSI